MTDVGRGNLKTMLRRSVGDAVVTQVVPVVASIVTGLFPVSSRRDWLDTEDAIDDERDRRSGRLFDGCQWYRRRRRRVRRATSDERQK